MSDKHHVLVICRTSAGQMYLGVLLNRIWYAPVLARSADEGIRLARDARFSLVIFDADLPEAEVRSTLTILRSDPNIKDLPLAVFITPESPVTAESLMAAGCSAVVTKPLDLALVYGVLGRLSGQPRCTPRAAVKFRVAIEEKNPEEALTCVNISEGGLYLRTAAPLAEGTVLHLAFTLPRDAEEIRLAAEVVRTLPLGPQLETDPGMGLRFLDLSDEMQSRLRNFVQWEMIGDLEWEANF